MKRAKKNQMVIGANSDLIHSPDYSIAYLRRGRGLICFSSVAGGARITIIPGDGLDDYHFDIDADVAERIHLAAQIISKG